MRKLRIGTITVDHGDRYSDLSDVSLKSETPFTAKAIVEICAGYSDANVPLSLLFFNFFFSPSASVAPIRRRAVDLW